MTDILPNIGLSRLFSNRIKNYLLFLQVTNNIGLICEITDYLNIREILNFLSTSRYIRSFGKIQTIEIRVLQAKVDYYERPKIQPTFQTFLNFVQIKVPAAQTKIKSQNLASDYETLKKQYLTVISKTNKKSGNQQPATNSQKTQPSVRIQSGDTRNQITVKNQKPTKNNSYPNIKPNKQNTPQLQKATENTQNANRKKQYYNNINPYYQKFQEVEYELAKEDFERRKIRRIKQQKEREEFMTIEELKIMAVEEPAMREIIRKIEIEEVQKIQRANRDKLKMKPIKIDKHEIQKLKMLQEQQKQKLIVVKQSIAQKIVSNLRAFVQKP